MEKCCRDYEHTTRAIDSLTDYSGSINNRNAGFAEQGMPILKEPKEQGYTDLFFLLVPFHASASNDSTIAIALLSKHRAKEQE